MVLWLGPRPDLPEAVRGPYFWIKFAYTLALGAVGAWATARVARPGIQATRGFLMALLIAGVTGVAAVLSYATTPVEHRQMILMGSSALVCPFYIFAISLPLLVALMAFLRRMAPTSLSQAGAVAGLAAGGLGAWVYSFHCTEWGVPFLAVWYSLGVVAVMLVGAIAGRIALRW
jgi:hypothetical protein